MHDDHRLYPILPSKPLDPEAAAAMIDPVRGTVWQTCWEYVLTHELTEAEGSAFWHGASLVHRRHDDDTTHGGSMITQVVHVASDTEDGLVVTVTVRRLPTRNFAPLPRAIDVPPDIRDAMREWLDNVPKELES